MATIEEIIDRYLATWAENDAARRRELIAEFYAPDAYYANAGNDYRGTAGVEVAVIRNWDKFISQGFRFESTEGAVTHHGSARIPWRMLAPDNVAVAAAGMQVVLMDDAGRITADYQFITQAPPG